MRISRDKAGWDTRHRISPLFTFQLSWELRNSVKITPKQRNNPDFRCVTSSAVGLAANPDSKLVKRQDGR